MMKSMHDTAKFNKRNMLSSVKREALYRLLIKKALDELFLLPKGHM